MSIFETINDKINESRRKIDEIKKSYMKEMQAEFQEFTKAFFEEVPVVQAIVWSQYTPYFNDGEACVFRVNDAFFVTKNFDIEDLQNPYHYEDEEEYETIPTWDWKIDEAVSKFGQDAIDKVKQFNDMLQSSEDILEEIYGDHCAVYLMKDRVIVEEYAHD